MYRLLPLLLIFTLLQGCILYVPDVEQGNIVTEEMVNQVKVGQSEQQVRYILGSPLIKDSFHRNRWDYFYSLKKGTNPAIDKKRLTIIFENGKVSRIIRNG